MTFINDGQARRIASEWHDGQWTRLYEFVSSGAIDLEPLRLEISRELGQLDVGKVRRELLALDKYVRFKGHRAPVKGWANNWDDSPVDIGDC